MAEENAGKPEVEVKVEIITPSRPVVIGAVRQVLMNDFGLSREMVREEMQKIIEETVERHCNSEAYPQMIQREIVKHTNKLLGAWRDEDKVKQLVVAEVASQVKSQVKIVVDRYVKVSIGEEVVDDHK